MNHESMAVILWYQGMMLLVVICCLFNLFIRYRKLFNKKSRKWSLYAIKEDKDYGYIPDVQRAIIRKRVSAGHGLPRVSKKRPDDPRQHGVLSGIPAPSIQELLETQVRRGLGKC